MKNNLFEDLAKVSTSVALVVFESAKNVQGKLKDTTQNFARSADLVTRDEFEAFKAMASKARINSEALVKDIAELKQQIQTITSSLDVIKQQAGKVKDAGAGDEKTLVELQKISAHIEDKLSGFESSISAQQTKLEELEGKFAEKPVSAPKAKKPAVSAPVEAVDNNNLFGNE